ncbi:VOC family protein [Amycolatopsis sp. NBC_01307]|uniref:VOC family protein n=1 Tax=Amycolatopsis sp. NBC_01307 TaxID=2903561 RepID=UPI002E155D71|nr:VOC family protein [Amycolatopsis sp. NBC_01307]
MSPTLTGVHHLKFPAADLATTLAWFRTALGAERLPGFDHRDHDGVLFGVIVRLPGLDVPVELRQWPEAAEATAGYDPVTFAVADRAALEDWVRHFDAAGVAHSPVLAGFAGHLVDLRTPDGLAIRLYTRLPDDPASIDMDPAHTDLGSTWLGK